MVLMIVLNMLARYDISLYLVHSSSHIYHTPVVVVTLPLSNNYNNNNKKKNHHRWYKHILLSQTSVTEKP